MTHQKQRYGLALGALLLAGCSTGPATGPDPNSRTWIDIDGRVCTQVDPPGKAFALDCDYPPTPEATR